MNEIIEDIEKAFATVRSIKVVSTSKAFVLEVWEMP
jgi:hypothetical protein